MERVCTQKQQPRALSFARDGFSVVELLIVFSIMVIIFAIVLGGITNFVSRQAFRTTVVDVRDSIIDARQETLASIDDTLYGIHVSSTAAVVFEGDAFVEGASENVVITFPGNITATTNFTGGVTSATFTRLTGIPSATGTITISDPNSGEVDVITISPTGLVE